MKLPWQRKIISTHDWEFAPYAFEPGRRYVIEINSAAIELEQIAQLDNWFMDNGLNVKLVLSKGNGEKALYPIEVKRMTEILK